MTDEADPRPEADPEAKPHPESDRAAAEEASFMGPGVVVGRARRAPNTPGWVPAALAGSLLLGVALGAVGTLLLTSEESTPDTTTPAAAGPEGVVAPAPAGTVPSAGFDDPDAYGTVESTGSPLPRFGDVGDDAAAGRQAPELLGADFAGDEVAITNDGRAKIVLFVAHWCPYCQNEVPAVRDWLATTELPDNVDVYSVVTLTDPARSNYPPRPWLEAEQWTIPVIVDDGLDTAANTFGLNAVPFWVFINTDGTVAFRHAGGGVPPAALTDVAAALAEGPVPADDESGAGGS